MKFPTTTDYAVNGRHMTFQGILSALTLSKLFQHFTKSSQTHIHIQNAMLETNLRQLYRAGGGGCAGYVQGPGAPNIWPFS